MIHSGSRGLGHQVATDALVLMEAAMARDKIDINDRQLACAKISSQASRDGGRTLRCSNSAVRDVSPSPQKICQSDPLLRTSTSR